MNPIQNPYAPGAGTQPPELAGRDEVINDAVTAMERLKIGNPTRSQIFVGLRGVGKTVLLNRIRELAEERGLYALLVEAHEDKSLPALLIPPLRKILLHLDGRENLSQKTKRGLRVLRSFIGRFKTKVKVGELAEIELGVDPEIGTADSGDLEIDLGDLLVAVAEAALDRRTQICLLIDELQYLTEPELSGLIMGLHQVSQRNLPFMLVGAGLPLVLGLSGRSKSYAERLFSFPPVGALTVEAATSALQAPAQAHGVAFSPEALAAIIRKTERYPYFLQQWAYEAWNVAPSSPILPEHVSVATQKAITQLDNSFFRIRFDRLTRREKEYLFAMIAVGGNQQRSGILRKNLELRSLLSDPCAARLSARV